MYRQGLGDCFLLSFPKGGGKHVHVMIDCGIVLGTAEPGDVMKKVAEDIKTTTGKKVDVLVITHEHWDHLSGFDNNQAREVFKDVTFERLWLAWTEEEGNPVADGLREEREKKKKAALAAKKAAENRNLTGPAGRIAEVLGFFGAAVAGVTDAGDEGEDGGGTAGALQFLKGKCPPTILQTGTVPHSIPGVNGVRVYVLGPPMDSGLLKKTNPYKGEGYTFGGDNIGLTDAFLAALDSEDECGQPFPRSLRKPMTDLPARLSAATAVASSASSAPRKAGIDWYSDSANQWRNIDNAWLAMGERLALQLDSATNNTSLVLAFEFDEEPNDVLLFVGDAQAGNWRSWDSHEWTVKGNNGEERKVTAADLLRRTIFYKVGHHGSHNATLREKGLERMTNRNLAAVIPVDTEVAHDVKKWKHMPLPAIRTRLEEKCVVVFQSDLPPREIRKVPKTWWEDSAKEFNVRRKDRVEKRKLYTDYFL